MRLRIKGLEFSITYPALCLFSSLIIVDYNYLYCILAVALHETAHLTAMYILKVKFNKVKISVFDIRICESSRHKLDYKSDIIITAAGPLANLLLFLIFCRIEFKFALVNFFIGAFNMLPAASLDGGQLLYLILSKRLSGKTSAFILDFITILVSIPLFVVGILVLLQSKYNFSLLLISLFLILSLFLKEDKYL